MSAEELTPAELTVNKLRKNIERNIKLIRKTIDEEIDGSNPQEVCGKLAEMTLLFGTSSECVAQAKKLYH